MAGELVPTVVAATLFLGGVALVLASVEAFVESVAEAAVGLGVSGFFLTVLLAGTDLENAVLGLAAVAGGLPGVALGTVFGEALFVLGAAVGAAGVVRPFETTVPRTYLLLFLASPALFVLLSADGTLTRLDGVLLTVAFPPLLAVVYRRESTVETQYLSAEAVAELAEADDSDGSVHADGPVDRDSDTEVDPDAGDSDPGADPGPDAADADVGDADHDPDAGDADHDPDAGDADHDPDAGPDHDPDAGDADWRALGVALAAVAGMTVGSELAVEGARDLLAVLGVSGLAFGATVLSFVASLEELFLTVTPVRRGRPHLAVGNVVGSVLFFVTANAGLVAIVRPLDTAGSVVAVHWPFFLVALALVGVAFARGRVGRVWGAVLLTFYAAYWGANYLV